MTAPSPDDEARALLQRRVAAFAGIFGGLNLVGFIFRAAALWIFEAQLAFVPHGTLPLQGLGTASLLAIWLLTRGRPRSARYVRIVEALGLLCACFLFTLIGLRMTHVIVDDPRLHELIAAGSLPAFSLFATILPLVGASFVLTYALIIRAAFVPTTVRHTLLLTTTAGLGLPLVGYLAGAGSASGTPGLTDPVLLAAGAIAQWAFTIVVCASISHIIYGLRAEVRQARRLGQYTIEGLIGEGGMGSVYRASHAMLRRPTAVKLLTPEGAGDGALERFEREVQLTSQLTHPNTVTIFDYGRTDEGILYYAMELLDGATLHEVVAVDGPQPAARVVRILEQVAGALGEAHSIGLIHRDVKPANIVLCRQGGALDVAKVVDFGLVKELAERHPATVSQDDTISGTPLYMAPEVLKGGDQASPKSDLYALGAVGYYLLTGTHVFSGGSVVEVLGHHLHTEPEPLSERLGDSVPEDLERLIIDCLAKDPDARPSDALDLRRRLDACEGIGKWRQRSASMWWEAHQGALEARREAAPAGTAKTTMAVDLVRRS